MVKKKETKKRAKKKRRTKKPKLSQGWNPAYKAYIVYATDEDNAAYQVKFFGYKGHYEKIKSIRRDKRYKPYISGDKEYYRYRVDLTGW